MIYLVIAFAIAIVFCIYCFWSYRVFPKPRRFRYNTNSDIHITESHSTSLHKTFENKHELNTLVQGELTDAGKVDALYKWTTSLWAPKKGRSAKSINPVAIANRAMAGETFDREDYNLVLAHCIMAIGIPSRLMTVTTRDQAWRLGKNEYCGLEYFDKDHQKWVWYDGQIGVRITQSLKPLSALEIKEAMMDSHILMADSHNLEFDLENYLANIQRLMDVFIACPLGQKRRFALVPPQLNPARKKFLIGRRLFEASCYSTRSFYAEHPTEPFESVSRVAKKETPLKAVVNN